MRGLFLFLLFLPLTLQAQPVPDTTIALPSIQVEASRATETVQEAPFAVAVLAPPHLVPTLTLDEVLAPLPGLWISDRENASLGERLSVRGMGWRTAFGVRGIQVLLDNVPLTMPDGQAVLTVADPSTIRRAELIRGPAATFWGNGSGGVLLLSTRPVSNTPFTRVRLLGGSHDAWNAEAEAYTPVGSGHIGVSFAHSRIEGYREHSRAVTTRARAFGRHTWRETLVQWTAALVHQPVADNPGALTAEEAAADPTMAQARNVATNAGKASTQVQGGLTLLRETPLGLLDATGWALYRDLDNPLSFAYIALDRWAGGLRLTLTRDYSGFGYGLGLDAGVQDDDRQNFDNADGEPGPNLLLDQRETVTNVAAFATIHAMLGPIRISTGLRFDRLRFTATDLFLTDGDDTGMRMFAAWSPSAGLSLPLSDHTLYANVRSAFETPTTTELANRPDGSGGFNPEVNPQRTLGGEIGARGTFPALRLHYDLALFRLAVDGLLTPFQVPDSDRVFYRNAGATRHDGLEGWLQWRPLAAFSVSATYAYSHFTFRESAQTGNALPGIPRHRLRTDWHGFFPHLHLHASTESVSGYFADDANTARTDVYFLLNLRLAHPGLEGRGLLIQPFAEIQNLLDTRYTASVVVNASNARYFEPAAGRIVRAGVQVTL